MARKISRVFASAASTTGTNLIYFCFACYTYYDATAPTNFTNWKNHLINVHGFVDDG